MATATTSQVLFEAHFTASYAVGTTNRYRAVEHQASTDELYTKMHLRSLKYIQR